MEEYTPVRSIEYTRNILYWSKNTAKCPPAEGYMLWNFSQHIDCQDNTKNIYTKFHKIK